MIWNWAAEPGTLGEPVDGFGVVALSLSCFGGVNTFSAVGVACGIPPPVQGCLGSVTILLAEHWSLPRFTLEVVEAFVHGSLS